MKCLKKLSLLFLLFAICIFLLIPLNKCFASVEYELNGNKVQLPDSVEEIYLDGQYLYGKYPNSLKKVRYINHGLTEEVYKWDCVSISPFFREEIRNQKA